jgi:hypothetical protein
LPRVALNPTHVQLTSIAAVLIVDKRPTQRADSVLMFLEKTQTGADDFAG